VRFVDSVMQSGDSKLVSWFIDLVNKLLDVLKSVYDKLSASKSWGQMKLIKGDMDSIQKIADAYFEGMEGTNYSAGDGESDGKPIRASMKSQVDDIDSRTNGALKTYAAAQIKNWQGSKKIVVYESREQFSQFVDDAAAHKIAGKKLYLGRVSKSLASRILSATGINVENFNCTIQAYEIEKIFKSHGNAAKEARQGQRAMTKQDILGIPEIIAGADKITLSPDGYEGKPVIRLRQNGNGWTEVVAVVSDKHIDLRVQTMYGGQKKSLAAPTDVQAPVLTSETSHGTAPNSTVSQTKPTVNTSIRKSGENDASTPISQAVSSAKTSIKQIPALFRDKNVSFDKVNIDIGGGKFDLATDYLSSIGTQKVSTVDTRKSCFLTHRKLERQPP